MQIRLAHKYKAATDTVTFIFEPPEPVSWQAGQYGLYRLPHNEPDNRKDRRFFTIAAAPFENHLQITTRFNPKGSSFKRALSAMNLGEEIELIKVEGDFVMSDPSAHHIMIAGGIGVTPYRSILKQLDHEGQQINVDLLYANRTSEFVFQSELEEIASRNPGLKIHYFVEPNKIDNQAISSLPSDLDKPIYWLSGPEPMVEAFESSLQEMGIGSGQIKTDYFPGYLWPETS